MGITHFLTPSPFSFNPSNSPPNSNPSPNPNPKISSHLTSSLFSRRNSHLFRAQPFGFDDELGFSRRRKRRNWWFDDDDDDDDEYDIVFGFQEQPTSINWGFEVIRAFGWMVPALLVPMLMGKEENSWMMALALPLGQTALSLVMDKLWGGPTPNQDPRPRSKLKSRARRRTRSRPRSERDTFDRFANEKAQGSRTGPHSTRGSYQSWEAVDSPSASKGRKGGSSFGGWDE